MIGTKYNRLTIIEEAPRRRYNQYFLCLCDCGVKKEIKFYDIKTGMTKSCGCLSKDVTTERNLKHSLSKHSAYHTWNGIVDRCRNPKNAMWRHYGGRGIDVCEEWLDVMSFINDMGEKPKGMQIDRIDNNKGYYKENCRWVVSKENNRNKRTNLFISYNGETKCITDWAEVTGIHKSIIRQRLKYKWTPEEILTKKDFRSFRHR